MQNIKHYIAIRESLTLEKKRELLFGLKALQKKLKREGTSASPLEPMNLEEDSPSIEKSVIAKSFPTSGNFDAVVNKNRGIQFASKEIDAIRRFEKFATPTAIDPFVVKYETSDMFSNNTRIVIKKHQDGSQFSFAAYISSKNTSPDAEDETAPPQDKMQSAPAPQAKQSPMGQKPPVPGKPPSPKPSTPPRSSMPTLKELATSGNDNIVIKKTVTFQDDIKGADILADFLRELDL